MTFRRACLWSFASGLLALGWEMAWSRLFNFMSASQAEGFGLMLGCYLVGLAIGAQWSRRVQRHPDGGSRTAGIVVGAASLCAFLLAPAAAWSSVTVAVPAVWLRLVLLAPVGVCGALFGIVFPWLCHRAVTATDGAGQRVSYVYVANILGAGIGSLGTGLVLFDHLSLAATSAALLAAGAAWAEHLSGGRQLWFLRGTTIAALALTPVAYHDLYEKLFNRTEYGTAPAFVTVIESRHGVIALTTDGTVIGNGVYDAVVHAPWNPPLSHLRPFLPFAVHAKPSRVLLVGLASGSWARVLAGHPQVDSITAVEISRGYIDLIAGRPEVAPVLSNPRVQIAIDDGRRWLRNHPDAQFDAILVNGAYPWRELSSNVLSTEFMALIGGHLAPGGVAMINTTGAARVVSTALAVFPHVMTLGSFVVGSHAPIRPDWDRWADMLRHFRVDGRLVFDTTTPEGASALATFLEQPGHHGPQPDPGSWYWLDEAETRARYGAGPVTTDDNLGVEYRSIRAGFRRVD